MQLTTFAQHEFHNVNQDGVFLDGYDVVAYFTKQKALKGSKEYQHSYKGITYQFTSLDHLNAFTRSPEKYIPQYGGYCTFGLGADPNKTGFTPRRYKTNPEAFIVRDDKLYLFYKTGLFNSMAVFDRLPEETQQAIQIAADSLWGAIKDSYSNIEIPHQLAPIAPPETLDMAFLVGEWKCDIKINQGDGTYKDIKGKWTGQYASDGRSIIDIWDEGMPTQGVNVRTFNPYTKKWNFTWTQANDDQWSSLIGYREGDKMIFETLYFFVNGQEVKNKITFYNITDTHFDYFIDASYNGGKSWLEKSTVISATRVK